MTARQFLSERIQCPICKEWVKPKHLKCGYKIVAVVNGYPSHGGLACKKCLKEKYGTRKA